MELPTLTADHKYLMQDGREIPSVSSVLQAAGLTDLRWVSQYALNRGTAIHDAILFHHEGTLDEDSLDPVVKPYLEQFKKFLAISGAKVLKAEQIVYDSFRNYAGKYDLLLKMNGATWLIDVKTNTKPRHVGTQLGAYYCAARSNGIAVQKLGCLVLKPARFMFTEFLALPSQADWFRALTKARES